MKFGSSRPVGRFVVDIDGCLRFTDKAVLTPADIRSLRGTEACVQVTCDIYDRQVMLDEDDRIQLNEDTVTFFHTYSLGGEVICNWPDSSHKAISHQLARAA